jgi:DNA primase
VEDGDEPILCFDGDKAGARAAYRVVDLALPRLVPGKSLRFARLPEGQDPDDLIKSAGADAMNEVLGKARPLAEMLWLRETADINLDTPERRAALEHRLGEILRTIADETVRMLLVLINHPWLLAEHADELAAMDFQNRDAENLRRTLLEATASDAAEDFASLQAHLSGAGASELQARMERAISHRGDWPVRPEAAREDVISFWHQIVSLHRRKRTLSRELKDAEHALGAEPTEANFARLKDVQERLTVLDGTEALIEGFGASSGRPARSM